MKVFLFVLFVLVTDQSFGFDRRQLVPEFEDWIVRLEGDLDVIDQGLRIGRRKEALEIVQQRRLHDLEVLPSFFLGWHQRVEELEEKNAHLLELLSRNNIEVVCSLRLFGREYLGLGANEDLARARALLACAKDYDLNLQCMNSRMVCRQ